MLRSSRALDSGSGGRADKEQALVHAALRDAALQDAAEIFAGEASSEPHARCARVRAIMQRVQQAGPPTPLPWWQARKRVVLACAAMLAVGMTITIYANVSSQPWRLESVPIVRSMLLQRSERMSAQQASQQQGVALTADALLACADAPALSPGERWMVERPNAAARRDAQRVVAKLRDTQQVAAKLRGSQATGIAVGGETQLAQAMTLSPEFAREASALRAQFDQASQTVLSRLPGQGEPK